jgi:hypothetical protein
VPPTSLIVVDAKARPGWEAMPRRRRRALEGRLAELVALSADRWPQDITRLKTPAPVYVLRAPGGLLVLFRQESCGQIVVLDLLAGDLASED